MRSPAQAAGIRHVGAIEVQRGRGKTSAGDLVGDNIAVGENAGVQARRIAQGLGQVACALHGDLIGRHHVDRLGDFQDRRISLGRGGAAGGDITVDRSIGRLDGLAGNSGCT